ncbi:RNA-directed DNA polymerase, eukaryota [Artemisia annua]|uniref:RNA-directed DNA polymerase, eukaryota n=1 Tax=Artemisia annua TaxID=35608 RepID=A0A2U1P1H9_ARTAN|nr:RNA-directed DNA polymerase, eukaryota [Artemisia annua]
MSLLTLIEPLIIGEMWVLVLLLCVNTVVLMVIPKKNALNWLGFHQILEKRVTISDLRTTKENPPNTFKRCKVSDRLIKTAAGSLRVWKWKRAEFSGEENAEWQVLNSLLGDVVLSDSVGSWVWVGIGDGGFSVGAIRKLLHIDLDFSHSSVFEWCKWIPKKCNIFGWRAELGRIPTAVALSRRNIQVMDVSCPLCGDDEETVDHLFTGCIISTVLWQHISSWCKVQNLFAFSFKDLLEAHNYVGLSGRAKDIFYGIIIIGCWSIWKARNNLKFQQKKVRMEDFIGEVKALGFLWAKNRAKLASLSWGDWCKFVIM